MPASVIVGTPNASAPAFVSHHCDSYALSSTKTKNASSSSRFSSSSSSPSPTISFDDTTILNTFVYPLTPEYFLKTYYRRKCVAFLGGGSQRIDSVLEDLLFGGDVNALLEATASDTINVWLRRPRPSSSSSALSSSSPTTTLIDTLRLPDPADALICHAAGASLYFRAPQSTADILIPAMTEAVHMGGVAGYFDSTQSQVRGEVEVFVSRAGHVTEWHYDFQENFTMQFSGTKTWKLKMPSSTSSLSSSSSTAAASGLSSTHSTIRGATPHFSTTDDVVEKQANTALLREKEGFDFRPHPSYYDDAVEVTLHAGDMFYFPAGCWHKVECTEDSLSINLSLVGATWADAVAQGVRTMLWRDPSWRQIISLQPSISSVLHPSTTASTSSTVSEVTSSKKRPRNDKNRPISNHNTHSTTATVMTTTTTSVTPSLFPALSMNLTDLYSHTNHLLTSLKEQINSLRPEHLMPPIALLSRRYDGLPGGNIPIDGQEEDSENENDDDDDDGGVVGSGVCMRYEKGLAMLTIGKRALLGSSKKSKKNETHAKQANKKRKAQVASVKQQRSNSSSSKQKNGRKNRIEAHDKDEEDENNDNDNDNNDDDDENGDIDDDTSHDNVFRAQNAHLYFNPFAIIAAQNKLRDIASNQSQNKHVNDKGEDEDNHDSEDEDEYCTYVVSVNFGSEDLEPFCRTHIRIEKSDNVLMRAMDLLAAKSWGELPTYNRENFGAGGAGTNSSSSATSSSSSSSRLSRVSVESIIHVATSSVKSKSKLIPSNEHAKMRIYCLLRAIIFAGGATVG